MGTIPWPVCIMVDEHAKNLFRPVGILVGLLQTVSKKRLNLSIVKQQVDWCIRIRSAPLKQSQKHGTDERVEHIRIRPRIQRFGDIQKLRDFCAYWRQLM